MCPFVGFITLYIYIFIYLTADNLVFSQWKRILNFKIQGCHKRMVGFKASTEGKLVTEKKK